ncbi:LOW QUALITY PROTEIN: Serine protease, partial [Phytophthora megakarya]
MTSAATDVVAFLSKYSNEKKNNIIYGTSHGTALVERLMHLKPPNVIGYALDGIATSSGSLEGDVEYMSTWDIDNGEVGDRFLALCKHDREYRTRFKKKILALTLRNLYMVFDKNPNSTCAAMVNYIQSPSINTGEKPSCALRRALGTMLSDSTLRTFIPPIVYRLHRCRQKDIDLLPQFFNTFIGIRFGSLTAHTTTQDTVYISTLLYSLITFSEMWEAPAPSMAKMTKRFTDAIFSDSGLYATNPLYCAFSKEKSPTCNKFGLGNYDANPIIYDRDEFWNKRATIPKDASVLLLSSKLDPQTPHKYAEYLIEALRGENKELVTFEYAHHGLLESTQLISGDMYSETCGMKLFASYVKNKGKLEKMDKSCVDEMP